MPAKCVVGNTLPTGSKISVPTVLLKVVFCCPKLKAVITSAVINNKVFFMYINSGDPTFSCLFPEKLCEDNEEP